MKTMKKIFALVLLAVITTSCMIDGFNRINGNRNVTEETRKIADDFTMIKASNGLDVYITEGKNVSVVVEADENLQDIIKTEVRKGVLRIYSEKNIWRAKSRKIYVTTPPIEGVIATSGSDVFSENTLTGDTFKAKASSGADMKLRLSVNALSSSSSSGSDLTLIGKANSYTASASSGSSTDSYQLKAGDVTVRASSGADINVYASKSIEARASSGGDIDFKGSPKTINKKSSSGGSVSAH